MRRCASAAAARRDGTASRRWSSRSRSPATACRCAPGCCRATPPMSPRSLASRRTCAPGGSAAACSSAMPACTRRRTSPSSAAASAATSRPGRCRQVRDNLQVEEVWVGEGERRKRYVLCLNPEEAARRQQQRAQVLAELEAELALLAAREEDHPKAACALLASRRYGRYLGTDAQGRPRLDPAKVKAAERFDGKFVVITNDDTLSAEDVALGYKGAWLIEACFRRMKRTGLEVRPVFHWAARRIEAHVKLCVLALQTQRAAELRTGLSWARIAQALSGLKAVRYRSEGRTIVQRTKIGPELAELLKRLGVPTPKRVMAITEAAAAPDAAQAHA